MYMCQHFDDHDGRHEVSQDSVLGIGQRTDSARTQCNIYERISTRLLNGRTGRNNADQFRFLCEKLHELGSGRREDEGRGTGASDRHGPIWVRGEF